MKMDQGQSKSLSPPFTKGVWTGEMGNKRTGGMGNRFIGYWLNLSF